MLGVVFTWIIAMITLMIGKVILLKDLSNIRTQLGHSKTRNNLDESVKQLKDTYGE